MNTTVALIEALRAGPPAVISSDKVLAWMSDRDLEIQGAVFVLLRDFSAKILLEPPLSESVRDDFYRSYLARVMMEGSASLTAHGAGYEIVRWMMDLLPQEKSEARLLALRDWLGSTYLRFSAAHRDVLVNGALEHVFERPELRRLFEPWRKHPVLARAYSEADLWRRKGGSSPLT